MILPHNPSFGNIDVGLLKTKFKIPKAIGYWRSKYEPNLPRVEDYIDESWPIEERKLITDYLNTGKKHHSWVGWSDCRICGKDNGFKCLGDDEYDWPEGFGYYIIEHSVKPPEEFIEYVKGKINARV
jgi:hypothetical protein